MDDSLVEKLVAGDEEVVEQFGECEIFPLPKISCK
jgi:hypothetical protein